MAQDDIYGSKQQWETIIKKINSGVYLEPSAKIQYYIKNKANLKHFKKLINEFEYKDISYIRRIQHIKALRKTCYYTKKNLKDLTQDDVKEIIRQTNKIHKTISTRRDFVNYNKAIWKIILPEKDNKGRPDNTVVPYPWRIKVNADKSLQRDRDDKLTDTEYIKIQKHLSKDPRMQLYFSMMYVNLARPQELCYLNLDNIELFDNYARIRISEHGKEGTKTLQLVDNYYYLVQWLNKHPFWPNKKQNVPLFLTQGNNSSNVRLTPKHANKLLRKVLTKLKIDKKISNYSFKRNGVTARYKAGESAQNIQKIAGWTSTNQLKTYDLSEQEEFLENELIEKGILKHKDKEKRKKVSYKLCAFCNEINPLSNSICCNCNRPLDREDILKAEENKDIELQQLKKQVNNMQRVLDVLTDAAGNKELIKNAIKIKKLQ